MDAKEFFKLMQQARQEAKKSIPLTKRAQQIVPVKCIAAITAAKTIAATHNVLAKVLPNATSMSPDTAQQRASRLLSEYYHSFITDIPYAKRQKFASVDQMIVNHMKQQGFVSKDLAITVSEGLDDEIDVGAHVLLRSIETHYQIKMISGENGIIPNRRHHDSKAKIQTTSRWLTLLHETAHTVYEETCQRFTPSVPVSQDIVKHINDFVTHPLFSDRHHRKTHSERYDTPNRMLSEGFADCYGAMMLFALTEDTSSTHKVVKEFIVERKRTREYLESGQYGSPEIGAHFTDIAFEEMMANKSAWINATPDEQKRLAFTYASNGLLKMANPERLNGKGENIGVQFNKFLGDFCQEVPFVDVMYVNICATEGFVEGEKLFYQRLEGHPMIDSMKKITNILKNEMEIFLTHSSMEALTKPSEFWRVLGTNPQWSSTVKEFRKEWADHRTHWQNTARQDLASLRVETHSEPKLSSLIVSAASILHTRLKKSAQPNRDTQSVQRLNR